jgi:AcrR family transcriptional regulator
MVDQESPSRRVEEKRRRIVEVAMRHFAERGYQGARVEDIARELGIAKGSIFQHFGSKARLFLACYERAALSLPAWLDAPEEVIEEGFFAVLAYWLQRTEHLVREDWVPNRVVLIGNYGTDLRLKRDINRFLLSEDPYGTLDFVEYGIRRGEVRDDVDLDLVVSIVDWLAERFQDALVAEELDPGLFHRTRDDPARRQRRIEQFTELVRAAIGVPAPAGRGGRRARAEERPDRPRAETLPRPGPWYPRTRP